MRGRRLKAVAAVTAGVLLFGGLAACGSSSADPDKGHVYYINNKPEIVDQLKQLATDFTEETGIGVDIQTAAAGTYDSRMTSELAKSEAPTMFNIGGFDMFAKYRKFAEPLQDTDVYTLLDENGKNFSYKDSGNSYTLPYSAEWFGIIYNKKIVNDYASKPYAVIESADDITDYATLKKVAESMQENKEDLGLDAAFATPGLDASSAYRFTAHMSRIPLFFEYRDNDTTFMPELKGTYMSNFKDLWDFEVANSPTEPTLLSSATYENVTAEFSLGKVAFYPNGVWAYSQIKDGTVADEDLGMLPYWMGIESEEEYGPAAVYDASWAINKNASQKDKDATLEFIKWMVTSDEGKKAFSQDMGFSVPFTTFGEDNQPENPLTDAARAYETDGKPYLRSFTIPNQQWQDDISNALVEYSQGTGTWDTFTKAYLDGWKAEWENNKTALGILPEAAKF